VIDEYAVHGVEGSISGIPLTSESGKKKFLLLKGKQQDIPSVGFVLPMKVSFFFNNILSLFCLLLLVVLIFLITF